MPTRHTDDLHVLQVVLDEEQRHAGQLELLLQRTAEPVGLPLRQPAGEEPVDDALDAVVGSGAVEEQVVEPLHLLSVHGERGGRGGLRQLRGKGGVAVVERVAGGREGHGDVQRAHHGGQVDGGL